MSGPDCMPCVQHRHWEMVELASSALAKAFYEKQKLELVQPLGTLVRMGSVGHFSNGQWIEVGTTQSMFDIELRTVVGTDTNSYEGSDGDGYSFEAKGAGQVSALFPNQAEARARAEVSFGSAEGYMLAVHKQRMETAQELAELVAAIRWAYHMRRALPEGKRWLKNYAVVVGIASAASATAVSALSANAAIVIEGSGRLAAPTTESQLRAKMKITRTKASIDKLWLGPVSGFAIQVLRIQPSVWRRWDQEIVDTGRRSLVASSQAGVKRPKSYRSWLRANGLADTKAVPVELVRASGRATGKGTVDELVRFNQSRVSGVRLASDMPAATKAERPRRATVRANEGAVVKKIPVKVKVETRVPSKKRAVTGVRENVHRAAARDKKPPQPRR
jgi:hypothetical protein